MTALVGYLVNAAVSAAVVAVYHLFSAGKSAAPATPAAPAAPAVPVAQPAQTPGKKLLAKLEALGEQVADQALEQFVQSLNAAVQPAAPTPAAPKS